MTLLTQIEGETLTLTLNRPEKRNALSLSLMQELNQAIAQASKQKQLKRLILQANGPVFCAGLDLNELSSNLYREIKQLFLLLYNAPLMTCCKVQGSAFAGGLGLIAACDLAYATPEATFCLPELQKGIMPALVTVLLKRRLLPLHLRELAFLATPITAQRAYEIGLITAVSDKALFQDSAKIDPVAAKKFKTLLTALDPIEADLDLALSYGLERLELQK